MIELYELAATDDKQVFSPYGWRIRLALHHKQWPFKSIPWRMTEKDRIAFADTERVPVLVDGEQTFADSWKILEYLDERYPEHSLEMHRGELRDFLPASLEHGRCPSTWCRHAPCKHRSQARKVPHGRCANGLQS